MAIEQKHIDKDIFFSDRQKGANMIAICSGTYGTGKTWLASNIAYALSSQKNKVLFFDADWGKNNIISYLGLEKEYDLSDTIYRNMTMNQVIFKVEKFGFDILAGNNNHTGLSSLPIGRLQLISEDLALISKLYNYIILDISSEKKKFTDIISGIAKNMLIIVSPDPQSMVGAYELIQVRTRQYPDTNIKIIVNQVNSIRDGMLIYNTLIKTTERFLHQSPALAGIIRNDARVRDCQKNQAMILSRYPSADAAIDIINLIKNISER